MDMKKENKKVTIEDLSTKIENLAKIVKEGFGVMATKEDLKDLATKAALEALAVMTTNRFDGVEDEVDKLRHHMDKRFEGLELKVSSYASGWSRDFDRLHEWMEELDKRVNKVEDKLVRK